MSEDYISLFYFQFLEPNEIAEFIQRIEKQREEGDKKKAKKATPSDSASTPASSST